LRTYRQDQADSDKRACAEDHNHTAEREQFPALRLAPAWACIGFSLDIDLPSYCGAASACWR
jgi:hypothetical protein